MIATFVAEHLVDCLDDSILKDQLVDGSGVAFLAGGFQPADAAPDDGFATSIVPVDSAEHFTTFATNDNLCKAVVAAVGALFAIGTGFDHSSAYQFFLHPQEDILWNDCFVVALHIVLRNNVIVLHSGFIQEVYGVGFL